MPRSFLTWNLFLSRNLMPLFSSARERRLWIWTLIVVATIYSPLGLARTLASELRDRGLISDAIWLVLIMIGAAIVIQGLKVQPRGVEIGVWSGIAAVYLMVFIRMNLPEERSHIIEYTIVALLIHEALKERAGNGQRVVPAPAALAILITSLIGVVDEGIQFVLPSRVFDLVDIGFNALAALMAVTASTVLTWARTRWQKRRTETR